ncbi:MAG: YbaB/EbfC family nucleoid-associated protein [Phycicoccus sp.]
MPNHSSGAGMEERSSDLADVVVGGWVPDGEVVDEPLRRELTVQLAELREVEATVIGARVTGVSHDGDVCVTMSGDGLVVTGIAFGPRALAEHDGESLAAAIMAAIDDGVDQCMELTARRFPHLVRPAGGESMRRRSS